MSKLYAFGCSLTFGHGLPDCVGDDLSQAGEFPSKFSYAYLVANNLGLECINLSEPGGSTKLGCYRMTESNILPQDIVLFQLPFYGRSCLLSENNSDIRNMHPTLDDKLNKIYYKKIYKEENSILTRIMYVKLAKGYLENIGCKFLFYTVRKSTVDPFIKDLNFVHKLEIKNIDKAADNKHPGVHSNRHFSKIIYNEVIKL